jgi:hypothetical protein
VGELQKICVVIHQLTSGLTARLIVRTSILERQFGEDVMLLKKFGFMMLL